ncbi:MAG: hypothetical protein ACI9UA_000959 [Pseudoalteromonas tetraodonis]|jgi:hypothetical protein
MNSILKIVQMIFSGVAQLEELGGKGAVTWP